MPLRREVRRKPASLWRNATIDPFRRSCRDQYARAGATEAGRYETRGKQRIRSV